MELLDQISGAELQSIWTKTEAYAFLPPNSFARIVAFAISQTENIDINDFFYRPTTQQL